MYPSMLTHAQNDVAQVRIAGGREEKKKIRLVLDRVDKGVREGHSRLAATAGATAATAAATAVTAVTDATAGEGGGGLGLGKEEEEAYSQEEEAAYSQESSWTPGSTTVTTVTTVPQAGRRTEEQSASEQVHAQMESSSEYLALTQGGLAAATVTTVTKEGSAETSPHAQLWEELVAARAMLESEREQHRQQCARTRALEAERRRLQQLVDNQVYDVCVGVCVCIVCVYFYIYVYIYIYLSTSIYLSIYLYI